MAEKIGGQETEIINHLLFHKAIIREPHERAIDLDNYLGIMDELDRGMQVVLDNPVDRAVAIAFQLVIDERFDPWNLDLVEFTKLYLEKIKKEEDVNFIIAGRLVMMAWSILRSQSQHILTRADRIDEPQDLYFDDWDIGIPIDEPKTDGFSQYVIGSEDSLITEAVRGNDVRAVTLMSLIEAFDEAREEIALRERVKKLAKHDDGTPIVISEKLHRESLQEDISATWQRICRCEGDRIPITQVWDAHDTYDKVTVFISSLFLAKMQKVELTQQRLPYGEIMIRNIEGLDMEPIVNVTPIAPTVEPMPVEQMNAVHADNLAVV